VVAVTPAEPGHAEAIAVLFEEMGEFYGAAAGGPLEQRVRQIRRMLFDDERGMSALLAWDGGQLAGAAVYTFLWPARGLSRSLYLKELYIGAAHRRKGVGKLLMDGLHEIAAGHECSLMEWTTDDTNLAAQRFYAGLGVPVRTSKLFYRAEVGRVTPAGGCRGRVQSLIRVWSGPVQTEGEPPGLAG
jgi:GNAT superfamily N-acetyltransferase